MLPGAQWPTDDVRRELADDLAGAVRTERTAQMQLALGEALTELGTRIQHDLGPVLDEYRTNLWEAVHQAYRHSLEGSLRACEQSCAEFNLSSSEERQLQSRLLKHGQQSLTDHLVAAMRERIPRHMRKAFDERFKYAEGLPRIWKARDNIDRCFEVARDAGLAVLENLSTAQLLNYTPNKDPASSSSSTTATATATVTPLISKDEATETAATPTPTHEKRPSIAGGSGAAATPNNRGWASCLEVPALAQPLLVLTPGERDRIRAEYLASAEQDYRQAKQAQAMLPKTNIPLWLAPAMLPKSHIPLWLAPVILALGWNELWALVKSPTLLILLGGAIACAIILYPSKAKELTARLCDSLVAGWQTLLGLPYMGPSVHSFSLNLKLAVPEEAILMIGDLPDHVWLYVSEVDASFRLHCILAAISHRFRSLMTHAPKLDWEGRAYRASRPPFALLLRRCAVSLQVLFISGHVNHAADSDADPVTNHPDADLEENHPDADPDANAFVENDLKGVVFPKLFNLNFSKAPLWFLRLCPQLRDLTTGRATFPSRLSFDRFLRDCPSLQSLDANGLPLSYFGLRGQPRHPYSSGVQMSSALAHQVEQPLPLAAALMGQQPDLAVGTPASVRGLTLQCDPEDLPVLLADWPNLERLRISVPEEAANPLDTLAKLRTPNLHQLRLTFERSISRRLTARVDVGVPLIVLAAGLRVCDLDLQTALPEVTLDLPRVEELTLKGSESLKKITLCCPALVALRAKAPELPFCATTYFATECRMLHLGTLALEDNNIRRDSEGSQPLDLDVWEKELPDFWCVRDLELSFFRKLRVSLLRVPPSVKYLSVGSRDLGGLTALGLRSLRMSGVLRKPFELNTPQLEELEIIVYDGTTRVYLSGCAPPLLHTLVIRIRVTEDVEFPFEPIIHQCEQSLRSLAVFRSHLTHRWPSRIAPLCSGSGAMYQSSFSRDVPSSIASASPRQSNTIPPHRSCHHHPWERNRGTQWLSLTLFICVVFKLGPLDDGPLLAIVRFSDVVPSVILDHLREERPDVLIISCPCINDALLLRKEDRAPNLRPLYAQDLAHIIEQSGAPVRVVLHYSGNILPHAFLVDLFETCKRSGLLLSGEVERGLRDNLQSFLQSLADMGIASAIDVLKGSGSYNAAVFAFEGNRPPLPLDPFELRPLFAQELKAHFPDIRLGELDGALERRSPEFACQCPASTPPRFRLVWACEHCTKLCPDHDPIESSIVLPDPASPLACLPLLRENVSRLVGACNLEGVPNFCFRCILNNFSSGLWDCRAFPLAECVGCHTRGLRMRSDAIAALPPFDERPPPQEEEQPPPSFRPADQLGAVSSKQAPPPALRVLCVTLNPDPAVEEAGLSKLATPELIKNICSKVTSLGLEMSLLCEPSAQALKAKACETRPDLVIYVGHGLRQAISIRGAAGMTKPLTWLGPDELVSCLEDDKTPTTEPALTAMADQPTPPPSLLSATHHLHSVLLACCNSLALGDHLLRRLADGGSGGLERVVATADELTDVEASRFLSTLLAYAPHNLMPATMDECLQVAFRQAQQARATYQDQVDPTTPLVRISRPRNLAAGSHPLVADNVFSRGPTLAEAIHATRSLARPVEATPLRCTCGCPEGPQFAIEFAKGCVRPAAPSEGQPTMADSNAAPATAPCTAQAAAASSSQPDQPTSPLPEPQERRDPSHEEGHDQAGHGGQLTAHQLPVRMLPDWVLHDLALSDQVLHGGALQNPKRQAQLVGELHDRLWRDDRVLLPYAQRCQRCGQAAFIIPRDLQAAFKAPDESNGGDIPPKSLQEVQLPVLVTASPASAASVEASPPPVPPTAKSPSFAAFFKAKQ
ncbi:putative Root hair defective 3 GTP-binding protein (RHD3) [Paratrimastix pyriformis]|uniref:Root hair defective 3 GTP-binding protein (RHD3) n=1 Tax=Paratrimastix pyriformis TaxID=342808 RepID=A0ABQ8UCS2_9EUKA|nr:putative Root hair defective 3 GTP-binding protein (RHD3) [Paratrimastix pyriformis]